MDRVVSGVSNNEMGTECYIPQFIVQIISGNILCKLRKEVIALINGAYVMLFVISFPFFFFQSHYSAVVNWVTVSSRVDDLAIRYFVRIAKDVSMRAL